MTPVLVAIEDFRKYAKGTYVSDGQTFQNHIDNSEAIRRLDAIEVAWKDEYRRMQNKMQKICRQMQFAKGDTQPCEECKKVIAWDEYAVNFGICDDCMTRHLKEDGLA